MTYGGMMAQERAHLKATDDQGSVFLFSRTIGDQPDPVEARTLDASGAATLWDVTPLPVTWASTDRLTYSDILATTEEGRATKGGIQSAYLKATEKSGKRYLASVYMKASDRTNSTSMWRPPDAPDDADMRDLTAATPGEELGPLPASMTPHGDLVVTRWKGARYDKLWALDRGTGEARSIPWPRADYYEETNGYPELVEGNPDVKISLKELRMNANGRVYGVWQRDGIDTIFAADLLQDSRLKPAEQPWTAQYPRSTSRYVTDDEGRRVLKTCWLKDIQQLDIDSQCRLVLFADDPTGQSGGLVFGGCTERELRRVPKKWYDLKGKYNSAPGEFWRDTPRVCLGGIGLSDAPLYQPAASF